VVAALARIPDAELVVAGGPPAGELTRDPEARRLTALAERAGVAGRVRLLGRVGRGDLPALYRSADLVVNVPWYEPFGIVPLEAMACGVPVVASAVGGLVDTVVDGVTGAHVPPRRPGLLAAALAGLLADPERRADLGAAGSLRARRRYGWDRIARGTLEVYAGLRTGLPAGVTGAGGAGRATVAGGAVDNRERLMPSPATLPHRGTSQPEVGFARAPAPRSRRWPR
jgi:D-inositol-3-phosphate glycosyltransferase